MAALKLRDSVWLCCDVNVVVHLPSIGGFCRREKLLVKAHQLKLSKICLVTGLGAAVEGCLGSLSRCLGMEIKIE